MLSANEFRSMEMLTTRVGVASGLCGRWSHVPPIEAFILQVEVGPNGERIGFFKRFIKLAMNGFFSAQILCDLLATESSLLRPILQTHERFSCVRSSDWIGSLGIGSFAH